MNNQVRKAFKWGYQLREMTFPFLILGMILLISSWFWFYLDFYWLVSLFFGLVIGLVLGIFMVLVAIRELETIEEEHMPDIEQPSTKLLIN